MVGDAPTRPVEAPREPRTVPLNDRVTWRIEDVADALSVSRRSIERLRSAGKFPRPDLHIGKAPLWRPETIRRWVDEGGD